MHKKTKYLIGEFAEKTGVSIRTLHYYDEIGLLKAEKNPRSGHRQYSEQDAWTLHQIVAFKFLGYSLEQIAQFIDQSKFDHSLEKTLHAQKRAFLEKKEQINTVLRAIDRSMLLLKEEGEVDSEVMMSLIRNIQTEKEQRTWFETRTSKEAADRLFNKTEEEKLALDKEFIRLSREVKRLCGRPFDDPEVKQLVESHIQFALDFIGEETMEAFGEIDENDEKLLESMVPMPFIVNEEKWLNQAMEYYMIQSGRPNGEGK